jgi:hypothetical protein
MTKQRIGKGANMKRKHLGSRFEDFLAEEGILDDCRAAAIEFKNAHKPKKTVSRRKISKAESALKARIGRTRME